MSFSRVFSAQVNMLRGQIISIETDITQNALNAFSIVGLADRAVEEAKDRVAAALKNSNFKSPKHINQKTVVSLAPAEAKKEGSFLDLAIALSYLLSSGDIYFEPKGKIFLGELSLNGELKAVRGILPIVQMAKEKGFREIYVPKENAEEAALIGDVRIYGARTLKEVVFHLDRVLATASIEGESHSDFLSGREDADGENLLPGLSPMPQTEIIFSEQAALVGLDDIRGQEAAKRGLEIAAAGGHNVLMSGPPGTGKTLLAKAFTSLLPRLDREEILEITGIHSIVGANQGQLVTEPPFRSPHHTSSHVSVVGGGTQVKPGEVTLAHRGVLFLDEFPEFDKRVIESLREPLEERFINISRAKGSARFPAHFILIAAMNPCPCGYFGTNKKVCVCAASDLARYRRKVSGPILDRIDLSLQVENVDYEKLSDKPQAGTATADSRERIKKARAIQLERFKNIGRPLRTNSEMTIKDLDKFPLQEKVKNILNQSAKKLDLSPRSYHRIIKLARTIADLDESKEIEENHLLEALQYRPKISY